MKTIVVKFGGSSLASAEQFRKVADIISQDPSRRYVVASAPGKRGETDIKVTDLLYRCYEQAKAGDPLEPVLQQIKDRFAAILAELPIQFDLEAEIETLRTHLLTAPQRDYVASRGEYLNSKILAAYLNFPFVDPARTILFHPDGSFDAEQTNKTLSAQLRPLQNAVVAGFYGALPDGTIHTFSRGGSDVTGSIVALAAQADMYENWTDVSGMLAADPHIVESPRVIPYISYQELRELSYTGASVLHEDAVFPVGRAGIPINIRNTNRPADAGTMIVPTLPKGVHSHTATGIAGRKGFSSIQVEKAMMNAEIGFGANLLRIFAQNECPFEHCPTGIDTISVIVNSEQFAPRREKILQRIQQELNPDFLLVEDHLAVIAVVGHGFSSSKGTAARVFRAIADADVNIRMIDQGSSEMNIIIGVEEKDYATVIRSIYRECFN